MIEYLDFIDSGLYCFRCYGGGTCLAKCNISEDGEYWFTKLDGKEVAGYPVKLISDQAGRVTELTEKPEGLPNE